LPKPHETAILDDDEDMEQYVRDIYKNHSLPLESLRLDESFSDGDSSLGLLSPGPVALH
jgi:hypothetical protein